METVPAFDRHFFRSDAVFSRIGGGSLGGKAEGLIRIRSALESRLGGEVAGIELAIPRVAVLGTDAFDAFLARNDLQDAIEGDLPDDRLAHAFLRADLPSELVGDLRSLAEEVQQPLAVRSSSLLEDALERPFAGIYETKMIPNNQAEAGTRFHLLAEAIKFVYASTFFRDARTYRRAAGIGEGEEKMAVMIQEIVGDRHGDRFYPHVSAVCRSYSYYPVGRAAREDGVVVLALGLGKTIVDGGLCWSYSPRRPKAPRPFASVRRMVAETQSRFWAVSMARLKEYGPTAEEEYLVDCDLATAEYDGTLRALASTYDAESDRLRPGTGSDGPRVVDFAPLLQLREWPLNDLVKSLLEVCGEALGAAVEIEMALTLPEREGQRPRAGFVQVRPMRTPGADVTLDETDLTGPGAVLASENALGNGVVEGVRDIIYVKPGPFEARRTPEVAAEVESWNRRMVEAGRGYLLIGFGRWGSADPWLGIPVGWGGVSGARAIVEATLPTMDVEPSQGSHFFHNLSSTGVLYFTVRHGAAGAAGVSGAAGAAGAGIDWEWLDGLETVDETDWLRHARAAAPLDIRVDGRTGRGVVRRGGEE